MVKPIALILLNYNTHKLTERCINSIQKYADSNLFEIIIADNGSVDRSLEILKNKFPNLIYLDNLENLGFAEGNNRAIDLSIDLGYEFSLLLNTDTVIDEDIVSKLYAYLKEKTQVAAVQPAIYNFDNASKLWNGLCDFNQFWGYTYSQKKLPQKPSSVKWITGCCFLIRNEIYKTAGKFNKHFFLYYEDVELSYKIKTLGYDLHFLPYVRIYHEAGGSGQMKNSNKEGTLNPIVHYYLTRNRIWFVRRYGNTFLLPFNAMHILAYNSLLLLYFIVKGKKIKASNLIKGLKDGILTPSKSIWSI